MCNIRIRPEPIAVHRFARDAGKHRIDSVPLPEHPGLELLDRLRVLYYNETIVFQANPEAYLEPDMTDFRRGFAVSPEYILAIDDCHRISRPDRHRQQTQRQ